MKNKINLKQRASENGRIILAHGEVTGHHHSFAIDSGVTCYADEVKDVNSFLRIESEVAPLEHQEHATIPHKKGNYAVIRQEEWTDADEPITVAD